MTYRLSSRSLLLLAATLLAFPFIQIAKADTPVRKVTVVGTATIKVVPDEMHWTISVSINDATVAKAKARHDSSLDDALKFIKSFGGAVKDLQTGGISINKQTYFNPQDDRTKPFSCSTQVTFTLTDFDKYGPIADGLSKLDGIQVSSVNYASSKQEATQRDALKQALLNAHDKANDLAVTAGCYIDKPLEIEEGDSSQKLFKSMGLIGGMSDAGTPAAVPGQIEISATVTATYDLFYR